MLAVHGCADGSADGRADAAVDGAGNEAGSEGRAEAAVSEAGSEGPDVGAAVAPAIAVAAGTQHTCALHDDGRVSCWGHGGFIGPGLPVVTIPVWISLPEKAIAVEVGIQAACALLASGAVRCWGDLPGDGTPEPPLPVQKEDGTPLTAVTHIAGGSVAFCGSSPAGIHCWGDNKGGELARPAAERFPPLTAVLADPRPRRHLAATVAIVVHDGTSELCGWGSNDSGIIPGPRGIVERPECQRLTDVLQLSAGDGHACAHRGGASFSCWGSNSGGQLGLGDEDTLELPLPGMTRSLPAGSITRIASGAYHTCALLETGAIHCWGSNEHGEVGRPPSAPLFAPVAVAGVPAKAVALGAGAGSQHTCAITADGAVHCWGYDNMGQLGTGALTEDADRHSPTPRAVRF